MTHAITKRNTKQQTSKILSIFPPSSRPDFVDITQRSVFFETLLGIPGVDVTRVQNTIYKTILGYDEAELRDLYCLPPGAKVRDHIPYLSLCYLKAAEEAIRQRLTPIDDTETIDAAFAYEAVEDVVRYLKAQLAGISKWLCVDPATGADAASLL